MYHSNGAPLTLTELLSTSLLRRSFVEDAETTGFALTRQEAMFPLLSQGDHPTTGKPCWYLHPCETTAAVEELLKEIEDENESEDEGLLKCLKIWFLVVEGAVKLSSEHGFHM
jgi:ubiquitin-like-conjugating enzyme ATG10